MTDPDSSPAPQGLTLAKIMAAHKMLQDAADRAARKRFAEGFTVMEPVYDEQEQRWKAGQVKHYPPGSQEAFGDFLSL
jgi:myo-inositol catabolism protein IolC